MYIMSSKGVLIEVSSQMRVPRTYKRFAGLMGKWFLRRQCVEN
jgi:rRNA small subunit pseudouridine methyltransferase Nep1